MKLNEAIGVIEGCQTYVELHSALQRIVEDYGFSGYNFMDSGSPHADLPFTDGTSGQSWERDYQGNLFVRVDPCLSNARRTNTPFTWSEVPLPVQRGVKRPGAQRLMEAAADHGFKDGLVVPYHFVDEIGRAYSSLVVLFWKSPLHKLAFLLRHSRHEIHVLMLYWTQRAIDLVGRDFRQRAALGAVAAGGPGKDRQGQLTDKERDVLAWAARGKTVSETGDILAISESTVDTHLKSILRKLEAANKTQAVAKAIYLGMIDV